MISEKNKMREQGVKLVDGRKQLGFADGFPYGTMRCTLEKYPKIIEANDRMFHMLHTGENSEEWREFIRENIFFMVPVELRSGFQNDLRRAAESREPIQVEHQFSTTEGGTVSLIGWVWVTENEAGGREFALSYMPLPTDYVSQRQDRELAYRRVLESAYDGIFRIDLHKKTVECIQLKTDLQMLAVPGTSMLLDDALRRQVSASVQEKDRMAMDRFLADALSGTMPKGEIRELEFQMNRSGEKKTLRAIQVELDEQNVLICCREITRERYAEQVVEEMETIRSINQEIDRVGTKQPVRIETYRVIGERVILRSEGKKCGHLREMDLDAFLTQIKISREEYQKALLEGKTMLYGTDHDLGRVQQLYLVRTPEKNGQDAGMLLFLYTFEEEQPTGIRSRPRVSIHTFGYFDVLVDGKPVLFRYEKSKEMLAVLVDRKGSFVANPYFISCLWENEPYSERIQNRCRQTAYRMMETLKQYGIEDIIEKVDGRRRIIPERVDCDYFHYLQGDQFNGQPFAGAYMSDYSWGEETLSGLLKSEALRNS